MMRFGGYGTLLAAATIMLAGCGGEEGNDLASASAKTDAPLPPADSPGPMPPPPAAVSVSATQINHRPTYEKILGNSGISLQWISFYGAERGTLTAMEKGGLLKLSGKQKKDGQSGSLELNGAVIEVNEDSFIFDGTITIKGTPDVARTCIKTGRSKFGVTQNRKYFRLREFEWCDQLTDYVDIYF